MGEVIAKINTDGYACNSHPCPHHKPVFQDSQFGNLLSEEEKTKLKKLISSYGGIFAVDSKKPHRNNILNHTIDTQNALPQFRKPYQVPPAYEEEIIRQVNEMLNNEIIRPSASPWNAPVIFVKKRDGTLRFVCDFRYLNDVTKRDTYPLSNMQDIIDKTSGSMYWSTLDAASAYWSIPLSEADREIRIQRNPVRIKKCRCIISKNDRYLFIGITSGTRVSVLG